MNILFLLLGFFLVSILFVAIWVFSRTFTFIQLEWKNSPHPSGMLGKSNPADRYYDVVKEFGLPSILDSRSGGVAIWDEEDLQKQNSCFTRIELRDEQVPHKDHTDFLYAYMSLDIPDELICKILNLSESISYDPLKNEIRARCHFMGANVATLYLAKKIVIGEISLEEAKANYKIYVERATGDMYQEMMQYLCQTV